MNNGHSGNQVFRCSGVQVFGKDSAARVSVLNTRIPEHLNTQATKHLNTRIPEHRTRGFTLVEMLVLIIIIAVMSSVVVPASTRFYAKAKFQQNVQTVVGLMSYARSAAIDSNSDAVVRFDAQTDTFTVTRDAQTPATDLPTAMQEAQLNTQAPDTKVGRLDESIIVTSFQTYDPTANTGNTMGQQAAELRFHEDGSSGGGQFVLQSLDGYTAIIEVAPMTGRTTASDGADYLTGRT